MSMTDDVAVARRVCPVIFLLDTSGSMHGEPIGAVNSAIEGILPELKSMNEDNADAEIMIGILAFSFGADWITGEQLVSPTDYHFNALDANGQTAMGDAFRKLNAKLSSKTGFLTRATGSVAPVLFLLSDGVPTDDYRPGLSALQANSWYKVAARVAVGYGDCDDDILREFTGNSETVLHTNDPQELRRMIRFVTITSSMVASKGSGSASNANPDDNTKVVAEELKAQGEGGLAVSDPNDGF